MNFIKIVSVCDRPPHLALEVDLTLVTLEAGVSLLELFSSALAASCCWLRAAAAGEDSLGLRLARTAAGGSLMVNCWRGTGLSLGVSRPRLVSRARGPCSGIFLVCFCSPNSLILSETGVVTRLERRDMAGLSVRSQPHSLSSRYSTQLMPRSEIARDS